MRHTVGEMKRKCYYCIDLIIFARGRCLSSAGWCRVKFYDTDQLPKEMANILLRRALLDAIRVPVGTRASSELSKIGNREWVGYGFNGQPNYMDRPDFPLPAVRFRPDTPDIKILREKEKSDWRKLTLEEKKALYRASFCQTFAEFQAPTGQWKGALGWALVIASMSLWAYMGMKLFVYSPLPESFSEESQKAQLRRMLDLKVNPVDGLSSKWDYENNRWK